MADFTVHSVYAIPTGREIVSDDSVQHLKVLVESSRLLWLHVDLIVIPVATVLKVKRND